MHGRAIRVTITKEEFQWGLDRASQMHVDNGKRPSHRVFVDAAFRHAGYVVAKHGELKYFWHRGIAGEFPLTIEGNLGSSVVKA